MPYFTLIIMFYHVKIAFYHATLCTLPWDENLYGSNQELGECKEFMVYNRTFKKITVLDQLTFDSYKIDDRFQQIGYS